MKIFDVYPINEIEPIYGDGMYIYDQQGDKYLDFYGGHAVISIGHCNRYQTSMMKAQMDKLIFYSNSVVNNMQRELALKLGEQSGYIDYALFLCNSGAEANENALKLASFYNGRKSVLAFKNSFHGRTSAAVSVTDNPTIISPLNSVHEVDYCGLNNIDEFDLLMSNHSYCAVIIEGIQGVGGIHLPSNVFLEHVQKLCLQTETILVMDEVQSGYGRSGKFFAHQHFNVQPDLITMAKGMGNGFPIGGVLIHPKFKAKHGMLGTTFGGSHLACAAAIAVLDVIKKENLIKNADLIGLYLTDKLADIPQIKEIRGLGLIIGIEMFEEMPIVREKLLNEYHIFTGYAGKNTIRLLPPLICNQKQADEFINAIKTILTTLNN